MRRAGRSTGSFITPVTMALQVADLRKANVTDEQLADTRSLQGAIMPDGQKYEDWIKDKEGSGKDVENE
jgi:hypothetical protein